MFEEGVCKVFSTNFGPSIVVRGLRAPLSISTINVGARRPRTTMSNEMFAKNFTYS